MLKKTKTMHVPRWAVFVTVGSVFTIIIITVTVVLTKDNTSPKVTEHENGSTEEKLKQRDKSTTTTTTVSTVTEGEKKLGEELFKEIVGLIQKGSTAPRLFGMLEQIPVPDLFGYLSGPQTIQESTLCVTCRSIIDAFLRFYNTHKSPEDLKNLAVSMCIQLQFQNAEVCEGIIKLNFRTIMYIIDNKDGITSKMICGLVLQSVGCEVDPYFEWTVDFDLGTKPHHHENKSKRAAVPVGKPLTILQLTDIHYSPNYKIDGNAVCGEPLCCTSSQGNPSKPEEAAGFWGDYRRCDLSWHAFEDALQQITKTHKKIDYIYMTGDIVDHAVWITSIENNTKAIKTVMARIKQQFPNIPVYPILGNHEPSPLNLFAPVNILGESVSTNWLFKLVSEEWAAWLPKDTKQTILRGGFYTVLVKPGFRIIALNNNVCYTYNWWQLYQPKDPYEQLKWLGETLLKAEKAGEKVHILGHIPSSNKECQKTWSREYRKIIDRFEGTITAQFNGHTHNDEIQIFYSINEPSRAINIAYNGGSLTQFDNLNSNYKLYSMDSSTYEILDGETWTYNLTKANEQRNGSAPQWYQLYSYKKDFGMTALTPADFNNLAHQMAADKTILQKYARFFVKEADTSLSCDDDCLKEKLCTLATSQVGERTQCDLLLEKLKSMNGSNKPTIPLNTTHKIQFFTSDKPK